MKKNGFFKLLCAMTLFIPSISMAKTWTLEECIAYAMENNISLQKAGLAKQSNAEDWKAAKGALLPSLIFQTSHNATYKPWQPSGSATVTGGQVEVGIDKVYYNGAYTLNANWTVWNGNQNHNRVKAAEIAGRQAEMDSITSALILQEQIAKLYVQILYTKEAIKVNKSVLEMSKLNEKRAEEMFKVGSISKADVSQFTATRAQNEYNVVQSESQARAYTRQLKQLLQITSDEPFDVEMTEKVTDEMAMQPIPSQASVYAAALENRPEIKNAMLAIESAEMQRKIEKAKRLPTISMNAAVGTNSNTINKSGWGEQMKTNLNVGGGISISVPIFDQKQTKTAVAKATLRKQQAALDMKDKQTSLYSTIEDYWIQADNTQKQFASARISVESAKTSYELLSEQFALGLKNIVELQDGMSRLLNAEQNKLQSKYMTILNIKMLEFYKK